MTDFPVEAEKGVPAGRRVAFFGRNMEKDMARAADEGRQEQSQGAQWAGGHWGKGQKGKEERKKAGQSKEVGSRKKMRDERDGTNPKAMFALIGGYLIRAIKGMPPEKV